MSNTSCATADLIVNIVSLLSNLVILFGSMVLVFKNVIQFAQIPLTPLSEIKIDGAPQTGKDK